MLKTDKDLDGDSLSYLDSMERTVSEERRRDREKQLMREGKVGTHFNLRKSYCAKFPLYGLSLQIRFCLQALWEQKKAEEQQLLFRDLEELKELSRSKMFGRPGHGAPTEDVRKKR